MIFQMNELDSGTSERWGGGGDIIKYDIGSLYRDTVAVAV